MTPAVETAAGRIAGSVEAGVCAFRGIPYAAPPVGPRRFRPPDPPAPWAGLREATSFGAMAPQPRGLLDATMGTSELTVGENCLTLNVWTPGLTGRRPVLVWLHGGGFTTGTGAVPWYDGGALARRGDVVVVTLNYRLGVLGFTHLADLGAGWEGSGNLGLLDQLAALRWVQESVGAFGGEPEDVTLFGESAGGTSVIALLAAPAAAGLFHRAIAQSASFTQLRSRERADAAARQLLDHLGVAPSDASAVVAMDLPRLAEAQRQLEADRANWFTAFSPVADGVVVPATTSALLDAAAARAVPLLLGTTRDEMHLFTAFDPEDIGLDEAGLLARVTAVLGEAAPAAIAAYRRARPGSTPGELASALATDHSFRVPAIRLAEARAAAGSPIWMYRFDWATPVFGGVLGACHGLELPFVFHNLDRATLFTGGAAECEPLADTVQDAWLSHVRRDGPGWPAYDTERRATMRFDVASEVVDDLEGDLRRVWTGASA